MSPKKLRRWLVVSHSWAFLTPLLVNLTQSKLLSIFSIVSAFFIFRLVFIDRGLMKYMASAFCFFVIGVLSSLIVLYVKIRLFS